MITLTIYNQATGLVLRSYSVPDDTDVNKQFVSGEGALVGFYLNPSKFRVDIAQSPPVAVEYTPPDPTLDDLRDAAKAAVAQRRWELETGGVEFNGTTIATDDRSKTMLIGAAMKAAADPDFTTNWKASDGSWLSIDATTILAIRDAVFTWVDNCFTREQALDDAIDAAPDTAAIEALSTAIQSFWST